MLDHLPVPPPGRAGWPWTDESQPLPAAQPGGQPWPRITIVTPSFNQAQFLEETIRSVLLQGYPNLEYFVVDGGSTDGSAAIIERYAPRLAGWVSEPDRGQSHAINKGLARATGDWLGWINSDDCYAPDALQALMIRAGEQSANFAAGASIRFWDGEQHTPRRLQPHVQAFAPETLRYSQEFDQPACLWRRELFEIAGPLDEHLRYTFDWQFFSRCAPHMRTAISDQTVTCYRIHSAHKTGSGGDQRWQEIMTVYDQTLSGDDLIAFRRVHRWLPVIRRIDRMRRRYGRAGLYYGWRLLLRTIRWWAIDRSPRLNPYILNLLELPYPKETTSYAQTQGMMCDGTVAGALHAFAPDQGGDRW